MCALERGLGRGLDSLFRNAGEVAAGKEHSRLPLASLTPNSNQPRTYFDEQALEELTESIRAQGIIQPILVRPIHGGTAQRYEIVAGERRWRAAQKAGLTEVPVIIRELTDDDVLAVALIENIQREDLNAVEEALAIEKLRQTLGLSQDELAKRLGKSRSAIANALRLLQLPEQVLQSITDGAISAGHARALLSITDAAAQAALHQAMLTQDLSVRAAESAVTYWKRHQTLPEGLMAEHAAEAHEPTPRSARPASRAKPPFILAVQQQLRTALHPKVTLSGTTEIGRVTLPYESSAQLAQLLSQLGLDVQSIPADAADQPEGAHDVES